MHKRLKSPNRGVHGSWVWQATRFFQNFRVLKVDISKTRHIRGSTSIWGNVERTVAFFCRLARWFSQMSLPSQKKYKKYPNILEPNVPVLADFCCMQPNQIMLAKMVGPAKNIPHQLGSNVQVNRFGKIAINSRYLQPRKCTVY